VAPEEKIYITLHNTPKEWVKQYLETVDPYVDIRSYTGYPLESWYKAGNNFADLAEEVRKAGDQAWFYQNPNHPHYTAEWSRLANGLYMWILPMEVHIPFRYRVLRVQPFDFIHNMGYTVASPEDGVTPIPLRQWTAMRLGMQDCWLLCMLEDEIAKAGAGSAQARSAQAWLEEVRGLMPKPEEMSEGTNEEGYGSSSPLMMAFAERLEGKDFERVRRGTIERILELRRMGK
jgi:hypothetical protein